ncbi:unnamed protein product [Rotaria sp. Silwood2]|nr:unnamed protein product [Rotaria sp. Silwood2]CAF4553509.1 unnamed protein product [Rotaria sp. Silwood2]
MASALGDIYEVPMEKCAYSSTGELGTGYLSPCVAIIITFDDNSVMIEHCSDVQLGKYGNEVEAFDVLETVAKNIRKLKQTNIRIQDVFIVGGNNQVVKKKLQRSLMLIRNDYLKKKDDPSDADSPNTRVMFNVINAIKIIETTWSFNDKELYGENESFLDVVVGYFHHEKSRCLLLRQCMNLTDTVTANVTNICYGVLCYKLNNISITAPRERLLLPDAQYYVRNILAESYKEVPKDFTFINECTSRFISNVKRLGAIPLETSDDTFINLIEQQVFNRMNDKLSDKIIVKDII